MQAVVADVEAVRTSYIHKYKYTPWSTYINIIYLYMYLFLGVWGQLEVDTDGVPPPHLSGLSSQQHTTSSEHSFMHADASNSDDNMH